MKTYIAGPMRGYRGFNFPAFYAAEEALRAHYDGEGGGVRTQIFNPARTDVEAHGWDIFADSAKGDLQDINHLGFNLRHSLEIDTHWICMYAEQICVLDGWENSSGAKAEVALGLALGHRIVRIDVHGQIEQLDPAIRVLPGSEDG